MTLFYKQKVLNTLNTHTHTHTIIKRAEGNFGGDGYVYDIDYCDSFTLIKIIIYMYGKVKVLVVQSYVLCVSPYSLCDHMDCSPPDSVHGIFQARILVWVAIPFSRGSS